MVPGVDAPRVAAGIFRERARFVQSEEAVRAGGEDGGNPFILSLSRVAEDGSTGRVTKRDAER